MVSSIEEKLEIAKRLVCANVKALEVGIPVMAGDEAEAIREILANIHGARLIGWNRGKMTDLERSFELGITSVHIGLPASDFHLERKFQTTRKWLLGAVSELVSFAKKNSAWVSVSAEDSGRADPNFLVEYVKHVEGSGADRIRISDTVGVLNPFSSYDLFKRLSTTVSIPIQAHLHNDFGLATANTVAAVTGGARHVHVTVDGMGERAGIASLEEIVLALERHLNVQTGIAKNQLCSLSQYVARAAGWNLSPNKAVVGSSVFEHESGIHVEGIMKLSETFEPFAPEVAGTKRRIVIGKHSGTAALEFALKQEGIVTNRKMLQPLLGTVRKTASEKKRALTFAEVASLFHAEHKQGS